MRTSSAPLESSTNDESVKNILHTGQLKCSWWSCRSGEEENYVFVKCFSGMGGKNTEANVRYQEKVEKKSPEKPNNLLQS